MKELCDRCRSAWHSSDELYNKRNIYSHPGIREVEFTELKSTVDNVVNICKAAGFDEQLSIISRIQESLADPTMNEYSDMVLTIGGKRMEAEELCEMAEKSETPLVQVEKSGKRFVDGTSHIDEAMFFDKALECTGIDYRCDHEQLEAIRSPFGENTRVIAGPGSGKTMVMVLNVLRSVFVDGVEPSSVIMTTFTRKASNELRSRIMSTGNMLLKKFLYDRDVLLSEKMRIRGLSFGDVMIGTLDSIAFDVLSEYRSADTKPMSMADESLSRSIMFNRLINLGGTLDQERSLVGYNKGRFMKESDYCDYCLSVHNHLKQNCLDSNDFVDRIPMTVKVIRGYEKALRDRSLMDFATAESRFLKFLESAGGADFLSDKAILVVDEYQDTNLLQERIYMRMAQKLSENGGGMKVVGDDDQAIYRFRGSDARYFTEMDKRAKDYGLEFKTLFLTTNYRSTLPIVDFFNAYLKLDDCYKRRGLEKPEIKFSGLNNNSFPVLGIFGNKKKVSSLLVKFANSLIINHRVVIEDEEGNDIVMECPDGFTGKDLVFLANSTKEFDNHDNIRLPERIHRSLNVESGLSVCNPKGIPPSANKHLSIVLGVFMRCIDPGSVLLNDLRNGNESIPGFSADTALSWLAVSEDYLSTEEAGPCNTYVESWAKGTAYGSDKWKDGVPIIRVFYDLMQRYDPQCEKEDSAVYFEMILRTMEQSSKFNRKVTRVGFDENHLPSKGTKLEIFSSVLVPLTNDIPHIDDEKLYEHEVGDAFNMMTIHQSKGLEFPVVVVDINKSFYDPDYDTHTRKHVDGDSVALMDSFFGTGFGEVSDAIYDDMIRKHYVAFSRARDVLVLVGEHNETSRISNIGLNDSLDIVSVKAIR